MLYNFKFFALAYLNDWWQYDKSFVSGLSPSAKSRRESLVRAATYYQVIRLFPKRHDSSAATRLDNALAELDGALSAVNNVLTPNNVDVIVENLANRLGSVYKRKTGKTKLISAASKFLWIRRQSAVIYDARAHKCLKIMNAVPGRSYASYRKAWMSEFQKYQPHIRSVCRRLSGSGVRDFAPDSRARRRLKSLVGQRWFHERVFDKFLWWNGT